MGALSLVRSPFLVSYILMTIAIQGQQASFHDSAAKQLYGSESGRVYAETFQDVFVALADGRAERGMCAIENSLYGSINEVYDLLLKNHCQIVGEVYLHIEQCLIGLPGARLEDITKVYSHPVALAQCEAYLDATLHQAEREEFHDTAGSVALVKQLADQTVTAIASREAAELHGLTVLAASIETNKQNFTRFIALAKEPATPPAASTKTSLILETDHQPGALYAALGAFAKRGINLSKLQSRPIIGKAWQYMFYVDVEAAADSPGCTEALAELAAQQCRVTLLGSYPAGQMPTV